MHIWSNLSRIWEKGNSRVERITDKITVVFPCPIGLCGLNGWKSRKKRFWFWFWAGKAQSSNVSLCLLGTGILTVVWKVGTNICCSNLLGICGTLVAISRSSTLTEIQCSLENWDFLAGKGPSQIYFQIAFDS